VFVRGGKHQARIFSDNAGRRKGPGGESHVQGRRGRGDKYYHEHSRNSALTHHNKGKEIRRKEALRKRVKILKS